jgi:hypothetical protein
MLGFAWFYSSESRLFNGLSRFQTKNSPYLALSPPGIPQARARSWRSEINAMFADFCPLFVPISSKPVNAGHKASLVFALPLG